MAVTYTHKGDTLAGSCILVTPGASPLPNGACSGILVTAAGNVVFQDGNGNPSVTMTAVAANTFIPIKAYYILAGTTATVYACY